MTEYQVRFELETVDEARLRKQREQRRRWRKRSTGDNYEAEAHRIWVNHIAKKYGMTPDDYNAMLAEQSGVCAACGDDYLSFTPRGRRKPFHIDHDHATGVVRSLLCAPCNQTLGSSKESIPRLRALIRYLERFS